MNSTRIDVKELIWNNIKQSDVPLFIAESLKYTTLMGSQAYGVSTPDSDVDIYGFCFPPSKIIFPHLAGYVVGFDKSIPSFNNWATPKNAIVINGIEHDVTIYSIINYLMLLIDNNPNIVDSIYTPDDCVLDRSATSDYLRNIRDSLLHKGAFHRFRGYAHSQKQKMMSKIPSEISSRKADYDKMGFDVKAGMHSVRNLLECQQILEEGTVNLRKNVATLKEIREYKWDANRIITFFNEMEPILQKLYETSDLPHHPDPVKSKQVLYNCLELSGVYSEEEISFIYPKE